MLQEQALNIPQLVLLGAALGMLIDIYRVLTHMLNSGRYLAGLFDLLFWLLCALWAFVYMLGVNSGEARLYVLALLLLGLVLEQKVLGHTLRENLRSVLGTLGKAVSKLISGIGVFVEAVLNAITAPFRFVVRLVLRPIRWLVGLILRPMRFAVGRLRQLSTAVRAFGTKWWAGDEPEDL